MFKIAVAKIILSSPERYGFVLEETEFYDPFRVERIHIELPQPLPLIEVARAIGYYYKEVKELNPHLSGDSIPVGTHFLNLPSGTSEKFWLFLSTWKKELEEKSIPLPKAPSGDRSSLRRPLHRGIIVTLPQLRDGSINLHTFKWRDYE